jgi:4-amino-4-deoxy-L-arabinose transferase-like glycosyltransferase
LSTGTVAKGASLAPFSADRSRGHTLARDPRLWWAVAFIVALVVVSQGVNMLHYPYVEDDEGTYLAQAWSVFHLGQLTPYTYIYDHAPLGWIQIAIWQLLTFERLGTGLASGRVLMLLYQVGSALLVLGIGRRATGKVWVGLLAATLFSLSSYGIYYHRRILLDNVATFWILSSLYLLCARPTLTRIWLSGVAIGIAVLSKETAIAVLPALLLIAARRAPRVSRLFAVSGWLALSVSVCSMYALLALLKGELFKPGTLLGGSSPHVSLQCSIEWQSTRGHNGGLLETSSEFWNTVLGWAHAEPLLVIGGTGAAVLAVTVMRRNAIASGIGLAVLSLWVFLGRGATVSPFYLLPLLPLLALCIALVINRGNAALARRLGRRVSAPVLVAAFGATLLLVLVAYERSERALWTGDPVNGQAEAVRWIRRNVPPRSRIVIDDYLWNALHAPPPGQPAFKDAQYYWEVGEDPKVQRRDFADNWRTVDYVVSTPQMFADDVQQHFKIVTPALAHSHTLARFDTGGWPVEVRRVEPDRSAVMPSIEDAKATSCMTSA